MKLKAEERIIRKGRANHLRRFEGVGGRLFLTNLRLFFEPHYFNYQTDEATIPLDNIVTIATPHSDFLSKKLAIRLNNNFIEFFLVWKRKQWLKEIEEAVTEIKKSTGESWHNNEGANEEIVQGSRAILRHLTIVAIIGAILTGLLIYMFL